MEAAPRQADQKTKTCLKCHREFSEDVCVCPDDKTTLTPISTSKDELVGTTFCERYKIIDVLGGGGMGKVYHAQHLLMQRPVAIKILHAKLSNNVAALKRFRVEAQFASSLSHPNILSIHDFGVSGEGNPYMVMDYLEGENLTTLLESKGRLSSFRAINIFTQICSALGHAHSKGIIHRDVKPGNIMLVPFENRRDFVKIVDFGIAKFLNSDDPSVEQLTRTGEIFGSPLYMSPEQCRGKELDTRADIYSLGAVMYLVLSGKPMFETNAALETMFKHVQETPANFRQVCPDADIPESLEAVVFKCLAKDTDQRYQSMADVKEALENVLTCPGVSQSMVVTAGTADRLAEATIDTQINLREQTAVEPVLNTSSQQTLIASTPHLSVQQAEVPARQSTMASEVKIVIISIAVVAASVIGALILNTNSHSTKSADSRLPTKPLAPPVFPTIVAPSKLPAATKSIVLPQSEVSENAPIKVPKRVPKANLGTKRVSSYQKRKKVQSAPRPTGFKRLKNSFRNFLNRL